MPSKDLDKTIRSINIDLLRAIAIIAVILFHCSRRCFTRGFLGVDIFFVIAGYFLTESFTKSSQGKGFGYFKYLFGRFIRLSPLVLLISALSLIVGFYVMLPDELENLGESVVATSFYVNNILACITTKNYWDVVNEYKPLMHTWYLGVLMQAYVILPLFFILSTKWSRNKNRALLSVVLSLWGLSLILYLLPAFPTAQKFYYFPFRAHEILFGAIIALSAPYREHFKFAGPVVARTAAVVCSILLLILVFVKLPLPPPVVLLATVFCSGLLLLLFEDPATAVMPLFLLRAVAFLGTASFSLYLWHQPMLAFGRYCLCDHWSVPVALLFCAVLAALSIGSYHLIEQKISLVFKSAKRTAAAAILAVCTLMTAGGGGFLYFVGGIVRDVPELDVYVKARKRGIHSAYNHRIYALDKDFSNDRRLKVLIIGKSFARDWANILLESPCADRFEISYIYPYNPEYVRKRFRRFEQADLIFCHDSACLSLFPDNVDRRRIWGIGPKNFGTSNGLYYRNRDKKGYLLQRTHVAPRIIEQNKREAERFGERYIDLIRCIQAPDGTVPVFTPDGHFISQDCRHLTQSGARLYSNILDIAAFANAPSHMANPQNGK